MIVLLAIMGTWALGLLQKFSIFTLLNQVQHLTPGGGGLIKNAYHAGLGHAIPTPTIHRSSARELSVTKH